MLIEFAVFCVGLAVVLSTALGAIRSFVLPRGDNVFLTMWVMRFVDWFVQWRLRFTHSYRERDRILALMPPITLLALPLFWMLFVILGFTAMFWAVGVRPWSQAYLVSGSSLLTLGFAPVTGVPQMILAFASATFGLTLIALLIAFLPTIYNAFSRREALVTLLDVLAGSPPSAIEMIERFYRLKRLDRLNEQWPVWEQWFGEVEETHLSFSILVFFRSQRPETSWVTAAGAILDTAALAISVLDIPHDVNADLCLRAGYLALQKVALFFGIPVRQTPAPNEPISVSRAEFDAAWARLVLAGIPLKPDREAAWVAWAGWRVNYDDALLALMRLTASPPGIWTGVSAEPQGLRALKSLRCPPKNGTQHKFHV